MIPLGAWLVDLMPGHDGKPTRNRFKVLTVGEGTCEIEDEGAGRRAVNRMLIERGLASGEIKEDGA